MITKKTVDEENDKQSTDINKMMYLQLKTNILFSVFNFIINTCDGKSIFWQVLYCIFVF